MCCVKLNGEHRPAMRRVEMALKGIIDAKEYVSSSATMMNSRTGFRCVV